MSWLCWFRQCRWIHHMNVVTEIVPEPGSYRDYMPPHGHSHAGLYQCTRCKTISIGVPR